LDSTLVFRCPAIKLCHTGVRTTFIDKHKAARVYLLCGLDELFACRFLALPSMQALFL
jgi:hypothetical protein